MMTAVLVVLLQVTACLGLGAAALSALNLSSHLTRGERTAWSFGLGYGVLGWALFFVGVFGGFQPSFLIGLLLVASAGTWWLRDDIPAVFRSAPGRPRGLWPLALWIGLIIVLGFDVFEAMAPPTEGDTLTYHFPIARQFANDGGIDFMPHAMHGAVPLLPHLTYTAVYRLAGEQGLMLWVMVSGWGLAGIFFIAVRRYVAPYEAMAATLILLTTPVVIYSAGNGQVEVRNALPVLVGCLAVARFFGTANLRFLVIAGLAAGFFAAGKYLGLIFVFACGFVLFFHSNRIKGPLIFGVFAFVGGFQWYFWNFYHTGDPVFPLLYGIVEYKNALIWDMAHDQAFQKLFAHEKPVPANLFWFLLYPFSATLGGTSLFESGRAGFGPFVLMVLPLAAISFWRHRERVKSEPLVVVGVLILVFYATWFFAHSPQRVRHLLPVYPVLLLCVSAAAMNLVHDQRASRPLYAAVALTLLLQMGVQGLHSRDFVKFAISGETRGDFIERHISQSQPVKWINANLGDESRILITTRQLNYLINVPVMSVTPEVDARINLIPSSTNPDRFWRQARVNGITHFLVHIDPDLGPRDVYSTMTPIIVPLLDKGCLKVDKTFEITTRFSRTLPTVRAAVSGAHVLAFSEEGCDLGDQ